MDSSVSPALFIGRLEEYVRKHPGNIYDTTADFLLLQTQIFDPSKNKALLILSICLFSCLIIYSTIFLYIRRAVTFKHYFIFKTGLIIPNGAHICALENILYSIMAIVNCSMQLSMAAKGPGVDMSGWLLFIGLQYIPKFIGGWLYVIANISVFMASRLSVKKDNNAMAHRRRILMERKAMSIVCVLVPLVVLSVIPYYFSQLAYHYNHSYKVLNHAAHQLRALAPSSTLESNNINTVLPYLVPLQSLTETVKHLRYYYMASWGSWLGFSLFPALLLAPFAIVQMRVLRGMADFKAQRGSLSIGIGTTQTAVEIQPPLVNEFYALIATIILTITILLLRLPTIIATVVLSFHTQLLVFIDLVLVEIGFALLSAGVMTMYLTASFLRERANRPAHVVNLASAKSTKSSNQNSSCPGITVDTTKEDVLDEKSPHSTELLVLPVQHRV